MTTMDDKPPFNGATHLKEVRARLRVLMMDVTSVEWTGLAAVRLSQAARVWLELDRYLNDAEKAVAAEAPTATPPDLG